MQLARHKHFVSALALAISVVLLVACPQTQPDNSTQQGNHLPQQPADYPGLDDVIEPERQSEGGLRILELFRRSVYHNGKISKLDEQYDEAFLETKHSAFSLKDLPNDRTAKLQLWITNSKQNRASVSQLLQMIFGNFTPKAVIARIEAVEVNFEGGWETLVDFTSHPREIDLLKLSSTGLEMLGAFYLESGEYDGLRFRLSQDHRLLVNEGNGPVWRNLRIFTGSMRSIVLNQPFTVSEAGFVSLSFDFSAEESLLRVAHHYFLRPQITINQISTSNEVSVSVSPELGAKITLHGQFELDIPPDTFTELVTIKLQPLAHLRFHQEDLVLLGQEYLISYATESSQFVDQPMRLNLYLAPDYHSLYPRGAQMLDMFFFDETFLQWQSLSGSFNEEKLRVEAELWQLGAFAVGFRDASVAAHSCPKLVNFSQNTSLGLDLNYFTSSCHSLKMCLVHGEVSYGHQYGQCLEAYEVDLIAQCQDICLKLGGQGCENSIGDSNLDEMGGPLYHNCLLMAQASFAHASENFSDFFDEQASCYDYQGLGISCDAPSCQLSYLGEKVIRGEPSDLAFLLKVNGSVKNVAFEGEGIYQADHPVLANEFEFQINETVRVLLEAKTFQAELWGLGLEQPVQCSAEVDIVDMRPCRIAILPDRISTGEEAALLLTVLEGWGGARLDLRSPGSFANVGLTALPDGGGYFHSLLRPADNRLYTAKVYDSSGELYSCSATIVVD